LPAINIKSNKIDTNELLFPWKLHMIRSSLYSTFSLTVSIILTICIAAYGQGNSSKSIHPKTPIETLVLKQWTAEDGLISNNLTSLNVDPEGFIWITSFNGLLKFDGNSFDLFDSKNVEILNSNAFMNSQINESQGILFSTQASGIIQYKGGMFISPSYNQDLPKYIRKVVTDRSGKIWAGANNKGIYIIQNDQVEAFNAPELKNITIMDIVCSNQNTIYAASRGIGLVEINNNSTKIFTEDNGLYSNSVNCLFISSDNSIYIGTKNGLNILKGGKIQSVRFFKNIEVNQILEDGYGSIWVATEMGLGRINNTYRTKELFTPEDGLPTRQVSGLGFDHEGNLWLSTKKGGLLRLKYGNFINYTKADGLALDQVNLIVEKSPGLYFVGSDEGGINIVSNRIIGRMRFNTDLKRNGIRDICFISSSEVWVGSYRGILIKKGIDERLLNRNTGLPADDIRRIFKDNKGQVWAGSRSGGLIKFHKDTIEKVFNIHNGFASNYILSIEEDSKGTIWVGTNGGGLHSIDESGQIQIFNPFKEDASGILIFNIHVDDNNALWLATNIGIFYFNEEKFTQL